MALDLRRLQTDARTYYGSEWEHYFWLEIESQAKVDLLAYALWCHGGEAPIIQEICFARHVKAMVEAMEQHRQTVFIMPPEHAKTTVLQWLVEMWLGQETERHFTESGYPAPSAAYVMNAASQSEKLCMAIASTLESNPRYRALFPHVEASPRHGWTKDTLFLKRRSYRKDPSLVACGIFGPIQGFRFGLEVLDDPTDQQDAGSDNLIAKQIAWVQGVYDDRLLEGGSKRAALTLWGQKGIGNTLLQSSKWRSLVFPAFMQSPKLGTRMWPDSYPQYPWGDVLWPEAWPRERLEAKRQEKELVENGALWQLAYLANPSLAAGNLFKRDWIKYADPPVVREMVTA